MKKIKHLKVLHPQACGIDVGSKFYMVAIGMEEDNIKKFGVYTRDHIELIGYLKDNDITHIAMESTGSYWQTLFSALQCAGFNVILVDGKQTKNLKAKTDIKDARAIYQLHSYGLLSGCFLPNEATTQIRVLYRHRSNLIEESSRAVNRMQKAMRLMNIRLDNVLSDVVGKSGRAIIEAIIGGLRDPEQLSLLTDPRVKSTPEEIKSSLEGQWDDCQLFVLEDCYKAYKSLCTRILTIDQKIKELLEMYKQYSINADVTKKKVGKNQINIGLEKLSHDYYGVDLFSIECVSYNLVMSVISEIGHGIEKFKSSKEFTSWLRLAPNNKVSGGKIISTRTPKGKNRLAIAFRNAANTISKKKSGYLVTFFRKKAYQKGRAAAITATARKIAVIIWNMLTYKKEYQAMDMASYKVKAKDRMLKNIVRKMKRMDIEIQEIVSYNSLVHNKLQQVR